MYQNMKPMLKYRGGNQWELSEIKIYTFFEAYYIDLLFGGGACFNFLEPQSAIINDINKSLMDFYRGIRNDFLDVKRGIKKNSSRIWKIEKRADFLKKTDVEETCLRIYFFLTFKILHNSVDEQEWYSKAIIFLNSKLAKYWGELWFLRQQTTSFYFIFMAEAAHESRTASQPSCHGR